MKYIDKILVLLIFVLGLSSCETHENFEILPAPESFQIVTPTNGTVIVLDDTNLDNNALFLSWKSTKNSSESSYTIEVAETGTDFANPIALATIQGLNYSMTVDELNTFLLDSMNLTAEQAASLDFRIMGNGETSATIAVVFTPYKVEYTELYLFGSLTNWDPAQALPFTNTGLNLFEIVVTLANDDAFKFIPTNISWDGAWKEDPNNPGTLINEPGDPNISGYDAGEYRIKVDLNAFTFTIERADFPNLFLVGDATAAGWNNNNNNYPMFNDPDQSGLYHYTGYFNAGSVKLLEQKGQWQPQWGKGASDNQLAGNPGTQTNDPDVIAVPTAGYYTLTVNLANLSYTLTPYDTSGATEYSTIGVLGRATPTAWDSDTDMTKSTFDPHIWYMTLDMNQSDGGDCDCGFKFRADNAWDVDWGGVQNPPTLHYGVAEQGGKNIGVPETGTYTIFFNTLDLRYFYIIE